MRSASGTWSALSTHDQSDLRKTEVAAEAVHEIRIRYLVRVERENQTAAVPARQRQGVIEVARLRIRSVVAAEVGGAVPLRERAHLRRVGVVEHEYTLGSVGHPHRGRERRLEHGGRLTTGGDPHLPRP